MFVVLGEAGEVDLAVEATEEVEGDDHFAVFVPDGDALDFDFIAAGAEFLACEIPGHDFGCILIG